MAVIELADLRKEYVILEKRRGIGGAMKNLIAPARKTIHAVDGISFRVEKGEMVGFIGPNGAGKSTTIKMLTGILVPTSGAVSVMGMSPSRDRKRYVARIGAVFGQKTQLWWDLPLTDTFDLLRRIYDISIATFNSNWKRFDDMLGLSEFAAQPVRQLSLGQRMRADIAAALLHDPEIVFFDEPTIGLDIVAKERIRNFVRQMNRERGITMLFTTHDLGDIEKTCDRVIIIDKGRLLFDGALAEMLRSMGTERAVVVEFKQQYPDAHQDGIRVETINEMKKRYVFNRDSVKVSELIARLESSYEINDLTIEEPEIESIVKNIYMGRETGVRRL
jgi:ABC-2 type transport system ATP-binding protein